MQKPIRAIFLYLVFVFVGGALLAPWVYQFLQANAATFPDLASKPLPRIVNRCVQVLALAGLWPLFRALGMTSAAALGLSGFRREWRRVPVGIVVGFGSTALLVSAALAFESRILAGGLSFPGIALMALEYTVAGLLIAIAEEILLRGAMFGGMRKRWSWPMAMAVSSGIYSALHFVARASYDEPVTAWSGLEVLPIMFRGLADVHAVIPGFFNLFLAGCILAVAYQRTGSLWLSIGVHAGWILCLKLYLKTTVPGTAPVEIWGSAKLIDGWSALVVLGAMLAVVWRFPLTSQTRPAGTSESV